MKILSDEYLKQGSEAFKNNDRELALTYYAKAAEVNPSEAEAYYCIGGVWFAKGDVNKAREFWKRTLQVNPDHKDAKMWLDRIGRQ
jgi:tetratricopeptide (TPR) repeat protein